jgi:hypothetical protein
MKAVEWFEWQLGAYINGNIDELTFDDFLFLVGIAKEMQKKQLLDFGSKVAMKARSNESGWSIEKLYNEMFEK